MEVELLKEVERRWVVWGVRVSLFLSRAAVPVCVLFVEVKSV